MCKCLLRSFIYPADPYTSLDAEGELHQEAPKFYLAMKSLVVLIYNPFTTWRYFMASRGMMNLLGEDDDNMFNTLRSAP